MATHCEEREESLHSRVWFRLVPDHHHCQVELNPALSVDTGREGEMEREGKGWREGEKEGLCKALTRVS